MIELVLILVALALAGAELVGWRVYDSWARWRDYRERFPRPRRATHRARLVQWNRFVQPTRWEIDTE